jgi:hypothetical protein
MLIRQKQAQKQNKDTKKEKYATRMSQNSSTFSHVRRLRKSDFPKKGLCENNF